jgi:hypothetical protein
VTATIASSPAELKKVQDFLELLRGGTGTLNACYAVGWTPDHLRKKMKDREFCALIEEAHERKIETVEERVYQASEKGNFAASQFILLCQAADRGWKPPQQRVAIQGESRVKVEVVQATREAILTQLEKRNIRALQPGIVDADVVDG